jgi:hypothetical protein
MSNLVPLAFWVATAIYFGCAYPLSPPDIVKGFSSFVLADTLFAISTCCLLIHTFSLGRSCRGCCPKHRRIKRWAYILLCGIIVYTFIALNTIVRGGAQDVALPLLMLHAIIVCLLLGVFFAMRYWHNTVEG